MASLPRITPKSRPPQLKADARRAESQGRAPRAMELLAEVLRQVPEDWPTVQRLADLRARAGDTRAAVDLYRRLGEHYEEDDHLPRAIAVWRIVLRHDPDFVGAHVKLGELYRRQGFRAESRRHYEAAVAGFEDQGRRHEAALARQALEAAQGDAGGRREAASPGNHTDRSAEAKDADGIDPLLPDEEELVAERLVEAKMYRRYNLPQQARAALETVLGRVPDHPGARAELAELEQDEEERRRSTQGPPPVDATTAPPGSLEPAQDPDLESLEFTLVLEDPPSADGDVESPVPASAVLPIRREHVDAQIAPEDYQARYDLGIAYREMGLLDEAIAELQMAARDPGRLVACASLLARCFHEKELPELALRWLERGLAGPACPDDGRQALQYELGHALEAAGQIARALETFTELYAEAAGYRDVAACVARLRTRSCQTGVSRHVTRGE